MDEQRKWFLEMETTHKDAVQIIEMTTEDLGYYINLVDKAVAGLEKTDSNFERTAVDKMLSNSTECQRESIREWKSQIHAAKFLLSYFKKLPRPPQPSVATTLISQQPSTMRQGPLPAKRI